ncbi:Cytochrome P450 6j1 [Frankliniella fusca]|uniref:Cytochrome P450 6j1 n=1 Tax=Frankliniella fusca TaxID=407009 RepID=A0AAE1HSX9_9NEOP|nr:Cytochrome P450 6j1 [Frankliniella fusca]
MAVVVALLGCVLALVLVLAALSCRRFLTWTIKGLPHTSWPLPLFGNLPLVLLQREPLFRGLDRIYKKFPGEPYVGLYAGPSPVLMVKDVEAIKSITVKDFNVFGSHKLSPDARFDKAFSNFLFCLGGEEWKSMRVKMTPAFSSGRLKSMYPQVKAVGNKFLQAIELRKDTNDVIAANTMCSLYGIDVIAICAFGIESNSLLEADRSAFLNAVADAFRFGPLEGLASLTLLFSDFAYRVLGLSMLQEWRTTVIRNLLRQSSEIRERSPPANRDIFDNLLSLKKGGVSQERFEAQVLSMQVAGSETSAATVMFTLWMLARYPEVQEKLRHQLREARERDGGDLTYETMHENVYLDMVFKEVLRLWPVMPWLDRVASEDYTLPGTDVKIEKGTVVFLPSYSIQRDPQFWEDPEAFNPERFAPENSANINKLAFLPFGTGPRACIGSRFADMSVKSAVSNIILNYEIGMTENTPRCEAELPINNRAFIITLEKELPLRFRKLES